MNQKVIMAVARADQDEVMMYPTISVHDSISHAKTHFFNTWAKDNGAKSEEDIEQEVVPQEGAVRLNHDNSAEFQLLATIRVLA